MLPPWVALLSCSEGFKTHCQPCGKSTPPFTPFPVKDYTADFVNFPSRLYPRANEFWIYNFPSISTELYGRLHIWPQNFQRERKVLVPWGWTNNRSQGISRDPPTRLWQESFTLSIKYSKLAGYKFYFLFLKDLISPQELSNKSILLCVHWKDGSTQSNCKKKRELERKSQEKCCCPVNAYQ